ncbi:hypothetical protein [Planctomycetes bacterium Pan216]
MNASSTSTSQRHRFLVLGMGLAIGGLVGWMWDGPGIGLLGAVAGGILGWAILKSALAEALAGAVKGALFLTLVGPLADWLINGSSFTARLPLAVVVGILVGATLGVRNARKRKIDAAPAEQPSAD